MPTPDQQARYDAYVKNGMRLMYRKQGVRALVKSLDGNGDPVSGLANTLGAIALRLTGSAKKAGQPLDPQVVLHGSGELLEQLADFSQQSGGHTYTDDELRKVATVLAKAAKGEGAQPQPAPQPSPASAPTGPELMPAGGGYGS
jgi:hypothetical protein